MNTINQTSAPDIRKTRTETARRVVDGKDFEFHRDISRDTGKLNKRPFFNAPPGTIKVDISGSERYEGDRHVWELVYQFAYDPRGWQPKPMNAGFFQRESAGAVVPISSRPAGCNFIEVDAYETCDFNLKFCNATFDDNEG